MFKPHVTVATVVQAEGQFLVVEEMVRGRATWNQPAGHLEADETLLQAAVRELYEETGLEGVPQAFLRLHQWIAPDNTLFAFPVRAGFTENAADLPAGSGYRSLLVAAAGRDPRREKAAFSTGCGKHPDLSAGSALSAGGAERVSVAV